MTTKGKILTGTIIPHIGSKTCRKGVYFCDGKEFIQSKAYMDLFWAYMDEYFVEYDRFEALERLVINNHFNLLYGNDALFGFAIYTTAEFEGDPVMVTAAIYIKPAFRGIKTLSWYRGQIVSILTELKFRRWSIIVPRDDLKFLSSWRYFGFEPGMEVGAYRFMEMFI